MWTEFGKTSNFYQFVKMRNVLPKYITSAENMQDFRIKLQELLIKCRENEFVCTDNRIISMFAVRDILLYIISINGN